MDVSPPAAAPKPSSAPGLEPLMGSPETESSSPNLSPRMAEPVPAPPIPALPAIFAAVPLPRLPMFAPAFGAFNSPPPARRPIVQWDWPDNLNRPPVVPAEAAPVGVPPRPPRVPSAPSIPGPKPGPKPSSRTAPY